MTSIVVGYDEAGRWCFLGDKRSRFGTSVVVLLRDHAAIGPGAIFKQVLALKQFFESRPLAAHCVLGCIVQPVRQLIRRSPFSFDNRCIWSQNFHRCCGLESKLVLAVRVIDILAVLANGHFRFLHAELLVWSSPFVALRNCAADLVSNPMRVR